MFERVSFRRLVGAILVVSFVAGFAVFVMAGAVTDRGTPRAIRAESARIMSAERARCVRYGAYAPIATLRSEGFLVFTPQYNSVVLIAGPHCGTVVIGSPAYQLSSG